MAPAARVAESLLLHVDRGRGLLLRLYMLKKDLNDAGTDLAFLNNEKPFVSLQKQVQPLRKGLETFQPSSKQQEELTKTKEKVLKHLSTHFDTILDAHNFVTSALNVFQDCNGLNMDPSKFPDLVKLYLDLVVAFVDVSLMTSRLETRKLIVLSCHLCKPQSERDYSRSHYQNLCQWACDLDKPLLNAYNMFRQGKTRTGTVHCTSGNLIFL